MRDLSKAYRCPVTGRFYDPLRVRRDLLTRSGGDVNSWIAAQGAGDPDTEEKLVAVARQAFGLSPIEPLDGQGWTDAQVLSALDAYTEYLAGKPEPEQTSPTSAPCTGC